MHDIREIKMSKLFKAFWEYQRSHKSLRTLTGSSLLMGLIIGLLTHAGHQDNWFSCGVYSFVITFAFVLMVIVFQFMVWRGQLKRN